MSNYLQVRIVLTKGSRLIASNVKKTVVEKLWLDQANNDSSLVNQVRNTYGGLTSFSSVQLCNRISVLMPDRANFPQSCVPESGMDPLYGAVNAYLMRKVPVYGCFHKELSGTQKTDVFIIDLSIEDMEVRNGDDQMQVYLTLTQQKIQNTKTPVTLILKSDLPVIWVIQSGGSMSGDEMQIIVNETDEVQSMNSDSYHGFTVKKMILPDTFDGMFSTVQKLENVLPISYLKVQDGNVMSLLIPKKQAWSSDGQTNKPSQEDYDNLAKKTVLLPGEVVKVAVNQEEKDNALKKIEKHFKMVLHVKCGASKTVVAINKIVADSEKVSLVTLNDPSCTAVQNDTHWILESPR